MFAIRDGKPVKFDVASLMRAAEEQTGLSDWGDLRFKKGLDVLVGAFTNEGFARMSPERVALMGPSLVEILMRRLQILDDRKKYPEIAKEEIKQPIFFMGMARTGSTLIQSLFAQDPGNIAQEFWEMMMPSPPPRFGIGEERRKRCTEIMKWHLEATPGFSNQHPYFIEDGFRSLAESGSIAEWSFASYQFLAFYPVPSYSKWFMQCDPSEAMAFHKMALQHLQWGRPGRHWVDKAVEHGVFLEGLLQQYPDAHFVWTHRDPVKQVTSLSSNFVVVRQFAGLPVTDLSGIGEEVTQSVLDVFERGMRARDAAPDQSRFHDVYYQDMMKDPIGQIRHLYEKLGRPLNAEAELRMQTWLRNNSQTKHGEHKYDPADYGIHREVIERRFAKYLSRYGHGLKRS
jgi:hypothetical protein